MQIDNPFLSCCGEADAYWADNFEVDEAAMWPSSPTSVRMARSAACTGKWVKGFSYRTATSNGTTETRPDMASSLWGLAETSIAKSLPASSDQTLPFKCP